MTPSEEHIEAATLTDEQPAPVSQKETGAPVFILGVMPRSGTNFLHRLLCKHPDCGAINTTPVREDYMVHHVTWLSRYLGRLKWQWGHWGADEAFVEPLSAEVGQGLTSFLHSLTTAKRFVTKTPSVTNLKSFFKFFPHAYLLIIVRDGRSVVASGMSGFGWNFETATRHWVSAARRILDFQKRNAGLKNRFKIVRYEELTANTVDVLKDILDFLELDVEAFDFEEALNMPVFGSSYMKEEGDQVSWKPREKGKDFNSVERWSKWPASRHARFNWLGRDELEALGYEALGGSGGVFESLLHSARDYLYNARRFPLRMIKAMRAGVRAFSQDFQGKGRSNVNLKR